MMKLMACLDISRNKVNNNFCDYEKGQDYFLAFLFYDEGTILTIKWAYCDRLLPYFYKLPT